MATDVIMPALGVAQETGILVNWLKAEGESVAKGEPIMEVETDKATVEVESPASGVLASVSAAPGETIPVGQTMAVILAPGESSAGRSESPPSQPRAEVSPAASVKTPSTAPAASPPPSTAGRPGRIAASPAARRIAREKGIELASLKGSGPGGSIIAEDVLRAGEKQTPKAATGATAEQRTVPLTPMRRIVGQRMTQSKQSAPHFYVNMDVDMSAVSKIRAQRKETGEKVIPSINDFILRACAQALKNFPSMNATYTDQGIQLLSDINIGMAVALEEGLVVPVIRNTDRLTLEQLARASRELIEKAQKKKLLPLDYEGGTFTVSNLGMFGVESFVAIINPPQCAILAAGQVAPRVVPDSEGIAVRSMMTLTLSADHRIVDGAIAARFLQEVKQCLEDPIS